MMLARLLAVAVAGAVLTAAAAQTPAATVSVQVVHAQSGAPIPGASVTMTGPALGHMRSPRDGTPLPFNYESINATTNAQGQGVIQSVPAGTYELMGSASGYLGASYGSHSPAAGSQPLQVGSGARLSVRLFLWQAASISGRVTDEDGAPIASARVALYRWASPFGVRRLESSTIRTTATDAAGAWRLANLAPGEYVVASRSFQITLPAEDRDARARFLREASFAYPSVLNACELVVDRHVLLSYALLDQKPGPDRTVAVFPPAFYVHASSPAGAQAIVLRAGDRRDGVDLRLRRSTGVTVSGTLIGTDGAPLAGVLVRLTPPEADRFVRPVQFDAAATLSNQDGTFTLLGVVPGAYSIRLIRQPPLVKPPDTGATLEVTWDGVRIRGAQDPADPNRLVPYEPSGERVLFANVPLSVDERNIDDIVVTASAGARVIGRVVFDPPSEAPPARLVAAMAIALEPAEGSAVALSQQPACVRLKPGGEFESESLPADRYLVRVVNQPAGWSLQGVWSGGRDTSVLQIDVNMSDVSGVTAALARRPPNRLTGTVRQAPGTADAMAVVLVFPVDRNLWVGGGASPRNLRVVRASERGSYDVKGLPDGEYYVATCTAEDARLARDAEFLAAVVARARRVTVRDGATTTQDLETVRR